MPFFSSNTIQNLAYRASFLQEISPFDQLIESDPKAQSPPDFSIIMLGQDNRVTISNLLFTGQTRAPGINSKCSPLRNPNCSPPTDLRMSQTHWRASLALASLCLARHKVRGHQIPMFFSLFSTVKNSIFERNRSTQSCLLNFSPGQLC